MGLGKSDLKATGALPDRGSNGRARMARLLLALTTLLPLQHAVGQTRIKAFGTTSLLVMVSLRV